MPADSTALEVLLGLYTTANVALVGAVIYLHVRFARVETLLSAPVTGVVALIEGLRKDVDELKRAKR